MQHKLMRSRYDKMIAGVCGGLGAYFDIDPTLIRLGMVLLAFPFISPFIYPILWLLMPVQAPHQPRQFGQQQQPWAPPPQYDPRHASQQKVATPTPEQRRYRFDPYTGQPLYSDEQAHQAATGPTIQFQQSQPDADPAVPPPPVYQVPAPRTQTNRKVLGFVLVAFGAMVFLQAIGIAEIVGPLLLISVGMFMLLRQRRGA